MLSMATKRETQLAYEAGQNALTEPAERRTVDACPFVEGTDERVAWLSGFADAIQGQDDLLKELNKAREDAGASE